MTGAWSFRITKKFPFFYLQVNEGGVGREFPLVLVVSSAIFYVAVFYGGKWHRWIRVKGKSDNL